MNRWIATLACVLMAGGTAAAVPEITREGAGDRRDQLDAMELTPFDQGLWDSLSDWRLGDPVDSTAADGKVVLFYTWTSYLPTSTRSMSIAGRLQKKYEDRGLIVVGVHAADGWDDAENVATKRRASFPIAHDADGAFRDALLVDQDPDFYLVDRAGQIRFADIDTSSLDDAVNILLDETTDFSAGTLDRMAEADRIAAEEARRTARIRDQITLANLPDRVPFRKPGEGAYEKADWPKMHKFREIRELVNKSTGKKERDEPRAIELPKESEWTPAFPSNRDGKITVLYFFASNQKRFGVGAERMDMHGFFSQMQDLQAEYERDLSVVGVLASPLLDDNRNNDEDQERRRRLREQARKLFDGFVKLRHLNHALVDDWDTNNLLTSVIGESRSRDGIPVPYMALIDSNGDLRWHGTIVLDNWYDSFRASLARMLENDPGVKARQKAEEEFLRKLRDEADK